MCVCHVCVPFHHFLLLELKITCERMKMLEVLERYQDLFIQTGNQCQSVAFVD